MYKRILLKLSGESLRSSKEVFDIESFNKVASVIKELLDNGMEIAIVVGGGNIFRGRVAQELNIDRVNADYIGMMATNLNGMMLNNVLNSRGIDSTLYTMLDGYGINNYHKHKAINDLKNHKVVIFAGGVGKPFHSTDSGAASKAIDIKADVILSGKHGVDGVYNKDPNKYDDAIKYDIVSFEKLIKENTQVMDLEALKMCLKNNILVRVFNIDNLDNIIKVCSNDKMGTTIRKE